MATKNKMRIAEKAFIYLMQVKIYTFLGARLQIFSTSFMGQRQVLSSRSFILISFVGGRSVPEEEQENAA